MSAAGPLGLVAAAVTAGIAAGVAARLLRPLPRLTTRLSTPLGAPPTPLGSRRPAEIAARLGDLLTAQRLDALATRLQHADAVPPGRDAVAAAEQHRTEVLVRALLEGLAALVLAALVGAPPALAPLLGALGVVHGAGARRAALDRRVEARRARMRIELYTLNQLLALHVRVGGGVAQAMRRVVERGHGPVVDEFAEILRAHRGGRPLVAALEAAAVGTAEPYAARTYRLLARGSAYGADLGEGLRALSDDLRDHRNESVERDATRRRAAMLVPIVALLAPVMLLFVAAPLPSIVFATP